MYFDKARGRILLKDGNSVVSSLGYAQRILNGENVEGVKVASDRHSELYDKMNNADISIEIEDIHPTPDNQHTEEELNRLVELLTESARYSDNQKFVERLAVELDFFRRTYNIKFILKVIEVINNFKENDVLWGVGRGSSCASLVAYVLYINDINPVEYNIPFKELSKEDDS